MLLMLASNSGSVRLLLTPLLMFDETRSFLGLKTGAGAGLDISSITVGFADVVVVLVVIGYVNNEYSAVIV